ncbi:hypothetical protein HAZT_HAZT002613 [Hyalella azteca]|uniref:Protein kinase domain-containing protein n=1 Tax=Hyalella azteca TaxID=294128 RepID=A0A6A0GYQ4_HYAAZ|nr:hypothetical protein HAZT_HAZT002613 [Hyalella azteca]
MNFNDHSGSPQRRASPKRSRRYSGNSSRCSHSPSPERPSRRPARRRNGTYDFSGNLCEEHAKMVPKPASRARSRDYYENRDIPSVEKTSSRRGRTPIRDAGGKRSSGSHSSGDRDCRDCALKYADHKLYEPKCCAEPKADNSAAPLVKLGDRYSSAAKRSNPLDHIYSNHDILTHMVSQTKAQKKQIRSLENEVERLRGCDALAKCEVRQRDVEWRPGDVLGEGSFSTVYRGTFCAIDVAVKELKLKLSQDDKNYFRSEAALLQQLHHPRVVLLMGVCSTAARPFMLLEYMSGGSLHALLHGDGKPVPLDHATYFCIARDVAQGMNYLHKHDPQVLHLDLKSMNVLLDAYSRAKIADFGFSILRRSRSPAQKGAIRGTPAWMAPELLTKGEVSAKCDVYSYAIILWEMLTSEQPFRGYDVLQILESVEAGLRPPLPSANVSRELRELITSCWAQNSSLRPSFAEVLGALEEAAVPPSWRGLFQRAHLPTSLPQDPPLARTVINAVQESVETLRRNKKNAKEKTSRSSAIREVPLMSGMMSLNEEKTSPPKAPARRRNSSVDKRGASSKYVEQKESMSAKNNSREKANSREKSNSGEKSSPREKNEGRERSKARGRSPDRNEKKIKATGDDRERSSPNRAHRSRLSRRDVTYEQIEERKPSPNRRPQKSRSSRTRQRELSVEMSRDLKRRDKQSSDGSLSRSSDLHDSLEGSWEARDTDRRIKNGKTVKQSRTNEQDSAGESQCSSWSSDEYYNVYYSKLRKRDTKTESRATSPRRGSRTFQKPIVPSSRRSSPKKERDISPPRQRVKSPTRLKSPVRRIEGKRRENRPCTVDRPGLALTAELLLDQKQKLRPVRPSALPDISGLPEKSLQDLTVLLRRVMNRRRDAFPPSMHSDDQFSDWQ